MKEVRLLKGNSEMEDKNLSILEHKDSLALLEEFKPKSKVAKIKILDLEFDAIEVAGLYGSSFTLPDKKVGRLTRVNRGKLPFDVIRTKTLRNVAYLRWIFRNNKMDIRAYDQPIVVRIIMHVLKCSERTAIDYYHALNV